MGAEVLERDAYRDNSNEDFRTRVARASAQAQRATEVLDRLEAADWRRLWIRAFDLPINDEFLAIVIQEGVPWFLYGSSNMGRGDYVFALWRDDGLSYFGECRERTDETLLAGLGFQFALEADEQAW